MLASARNFTLDWYWMGMASLVDAPVDSFYVMIWKRSEAMRSRLEQHGRQVAHVYPDKEKCDCYMTVTDCYRL